MLLLNNIKIVNVAVNTMIYITKIKEFMKNL